MAKEGEANTEMPLSSDDPASFAPGRSRRRHAVATAPFAGRIGGNQEFIASGYDEESEEILKKQPDAVRKIPAVQNATNRLIDDEGASPESFGFDQP